MTDPMPQSRRPISTRNSGWAQSIARKLSKTGITPNQISGLSVVFSLLAFGFYTLFSTTNPEHLWTAGWPLLAAIVAIQCRLLCNLFDGMVAMEGGKASSDGAFWNEFPDRVADLLILLGAGIAIGDISLGWAAAALSIFVSYTRELGRANGLPADYSGPMAKQHRMALLSVATLAAFLEPIWTDKPGVLYWALVLICVGCGVTIIRRAAKQISKLKDG